MKKILNQLSIINFLVITIAGIINAIGVTTVSYTHLALDEYRRKYLPEELGTSTRKLAELIIRNLA